MGDATDRSIGDLTSAGWGLVLLCIGATALIAFVVGPWALEAVDRSLLRQRWPLVLLAIPGFLAGWITYLGGAALLRRAGIALWRQRGPDEDA